MIGLAQRYRPALSTPFGREGYREIAPCAALAPFVRCFWSDDHTLTREILVIPDTCMDIIFEISKIGREGFFCALDDSSFYSVGDGAELFGIRFYAWTARLFSRRDFSKSGSRRFELGEFFDGTEELSRAVQCAGTFEERAAAAEKWLAERLCAVSQDNDLLNAVDLIIEKNGALNIADLCMHTAVSARTLERLFMRDIGASPKSFSSLVRYQLLWQDMLRPGFDVLDAVEKFGYSDQPHLINDFKRRHLMNPRQAVDYAKRRG
ncbi:MAG: AraC family transcriptional regulator [Oscillospiraceae bacterium]|nr:AraC family transcriptional regulator [Oscillospiraceae bacterium]